MLWLLLLVRCMYGEKILLLVESNGAGREAPEPVLGMDATTVKAAYSSRYALLRNGTVKAWGGNAAGQRGNGTTSDAVNPVTVRGAG